MATEIAGKQVDDLLLMQYKQLIAGSFSVTLLSGPGVMQAFEKGRQEIHDAILKSVGETRGSNFDDELWKWREQIYKDLMEGGGAR